MSTSDPNQVKMLDLGDDWIHKMQRHVFGTKHLVGIFSGSNFEDVFTTFLGRICNFSVSEETSSNFHCRKQCQKGTSWGQDCKDASFVSYAKSRAIKSYSYQIYVTSCHLQRKYRDMGAKLNMFAWSKSIVTCTYTKSNSFGGNYI